MAILKISNFYFASCVLLLLNWRSSSALPVCTLSADQCKDCAAHFKKLLLNVAELPNNEDVCFGIHSDKMVVNSNAKTVETCAPTLTQTSGCMMQRNSPFSKCECLKNIMKDMAHYAAAINTYMKTNLRSPVKEVAILNQTLDIIEDLRKNCSLVPDGGNDSSEAEAAQMWGDNTFNNRQEMCKMMRGFHIRTITINRAMGYISSGDHRQ